MSSSLCKTSEKGLTDFRSMFSFYTRLFLMFLGDTENELWPEMGYPFQASVAFHIETSHLICIANQMTGFYMKRNAELKWVKDSS